MSRRIVIVQGHPDPAGGYLCHALANAHAEGATAGGHAVRRIEAARLDLPLLRSKAAFDHGTAPPAAAEGQPAFARAEHLVFLYPLWLGSMPALLTGFAEQTFRPGFAFEPGRMRGGLARRSARVVVTRGMPALAYRWWFGAHSPDRAAPQARRVPLRHPTRPGHPHPISTPATTTPSRSAGEFPATPSSPNTNAGNVLWNQRRPRPSPAQADPRPGTHAARFASRRHCVSRNSV